MVQSRRKNEVAPPIYMLVPQKIQNFLCRLHRLFCQKSSFSLPLIKTCPPKTRLLGAPKLIRLFVMCFDEIRRFCWPPKFPVFARVWSNTVPKRHKSAQSNRVYAVQRFIPFHNHIWTSPISKRKAVHLPRVCTAFLAKWRFDVIKRYFYFHSFSNPRQIITTKKCSISPCVDV